MKIDVKHFAMTLDEIGYSVGMALMVIGLFVSTVVLLIGIAVLVLSLLLPDFVVFEFGSDLKEDENAEA